MTDIWDKANQVSEVGYRLDGVAGILELLGESLSDDVNSGACWTCAEWLKKYGAELEQLAVDIMQLNAPKIEEPKKGKKK